MEPVFRAFRRRLTPVTQWFGKLFASLTPQNKEIPSQRMCPFCGLITSRSKTCCMECGKALNAA